MQASGCMSTHRRSPVQGGKNPKYGQLAERLDAVPTSLGRGNRWQRRANAIKRVPETQVCSRLIVTRNLSKGQLSGIIDRPSASVAKQTRGSVFSKGRPRPPKKLSSCQFDCSAEWCLRQRAEKRWELKKSH